MICLAYLSSATPAMDAAALGAAVEHSGRNNQARGTTGLLCHYDGSFLQFLEGDEDKVQALFEAISKGQAPRRADHHAPPGGVDTSVWRLVDGPGLP